MYERKKTDSVDQAHLEIFVTKYKPKKGYASLNQNRAKKLDWSIMTSCFKVLSQYIKRCVYVVSICMNSLRMELTLHLPTSFGWTLDEDETYCIQRFEGDVAPKIIEVVKDDSCSGYWEFSNSKIQRCLYCKITVTPIWIIQPSFRFLLTRNSFSIFYNWNRFFRQQYDYTMKIFAMVSYVNWILWDQVIFNFLLIL